MTLTTGYADAVKIQKGELDANAAFMQGKVKVTGNMAKVMAAAAHHQLARVQAAPDRDRRHHRVLIRARAVDPRELRRLRRRTA